MNPWAQHPVLRGVPVTARSLPPAWTWRVAVEERLVRLGGRVAANPELPHLKAFDKLSEGPLPPLVKKLVGRIEVPQDAERAVFFWIQEQARSRAAAVVSHVKTGSPTVDQMAFTYQVNPKTVRRWIRDSIDKAGSKRLIDMVLNLLPTAQPFEPQAIPVQKGTIYFVSGSQSPGYIEGLARMRRQGFGIGIDISRCPEKCMLALEHAAASGAPLFVDSGAYGELTSGEKITDAEWVERLDDYEVLAELYGSNAYLVAPDKIASQKETERRLKKHGSRLKSAASKHKANILLVAQTGATPRDTFWKRMRKILVGKGIPSSKIVLAIPMAKFPATIEEVVDLARIKGVKAVHLLGMGPVKADDYIRAIKRTSPGTRVTTDAALVLSGARRGYLSVDPKHLTYAQDIVRYSIMSEAFQKSFRGGMAMLGWVELEGWGQKPVPDYTDQIYEDADYWMNSWLRRLLAAHLMEGTWGPKPSKKALLLLMGSDKTRPKTPARPSEFLWSPVHEDEEDGLKWGELPSVDAWLDDMWCRYLGSYFSARVKLESIMKAYRSGSPGAMRREVPGIEEGVDAIFPGRR